MLQGSITALITPFRDGAVDEAAYRDFIAWQLDQGTEGVVPCGTTGESPTLSHDEHKRVVKLCVDAVGGKVPVIAGTGSNSTDEAIDLTKHAKSVGADAALVVVPYYNKPTQAGLYAHFKAIHDAADLPIVIYNIPPRSVVDMTVETMAELAKLPRIIGVKDATQDLSRPIKTYLATGPEFTQLSGEDATAVPFLAAGGNGCISVAANVAPGLCSRMQRAWREGGVGEAIALQNKLMVLNTALFCESSPGPVKYAASLLGKCSAEVRLPLVEISDASKAEVKHAMHAVGLIA
jgi:4-hydroxy-tetrahydrodipicolinate synthase